MMTGNTLTIDTIANGKEIRDTMEKKMIDQGEVTGIEVGIGIVSGLRMCQGQGIPYSWPTDMAMDSGLSVIAVPQSLLIRNRTPPCGIDMVVVASEIRREG